MHDVSFFEDKGYGGQIRDTVDSNYRYRYFSYLPSLVMMDVLSTTGNGTRYLLALCDAVSPSTQKRSVCTGAATVCKRAHRQPTRSVTEEL